MMNAILRYVFYLLSSVGSLQFGSALGLNNPHKFAFQVQDFINTVDLLYENHVNLVTRRLQAYLLLVF